ncbi:MAG TPA: bifunctional 2-polyprenyl-6-hydroxyphenol methylase/3-demethylubiquinol 3-O-methyltransferase UbiG [Roseomonas sp.]|jgi:2-polyprenyl-6-hydroxyphenyl methylase/3-demethylubiquinone-9 3-methyltransferase
MAAGGTARAEEVAKFDALAARWWDPRGPMAPLHAMNPLRTGWIADRLAARHGGSLTGVSVLDIGCGAGLASEALARRGALVTGMDAAPDALAAARAHAEAEGLAIDYCRGGPEDLPPDARFDAVVALEVIEHVDAREAFLAGLAGALKPGGMLFLSTMNRTPRAWLMAKLGAEYVLRLLPAGTHDWRMFISPGELGALLRPRGLRVTDLAGMSMHPLTRRWRESRDLGVNYILAAERG